MNTFTKLLASAAMMGLVTPAFANDSSAKTETSIERKDNGGYEKSATTESTTPAGKTSTEKNVDVSVDDDGSSEKTTTTKRVNDPKGMFNKDTAKTKTTESVDKYGKRTVESEKTVNGKTVSETKKSTY